MLKGLDLSAYQKNVDFSKVKKAGIDFVILRSIISSGKLDSCFNKYYEECVKNDIAVGAYYFPYADTKEESKAKAELVVDVLKGRHLDLPIFLDLEEANLKKMDVTPIIEGAKEVIEKAGYRFGIYCNVDWYKNVKGIQECVVKYNIPLWIARYPANDNTYRENKKPNIGECIWQWTSHGTVSGVPSRCDRNMMYENIIVKDAEEQGKVILPNLSGYTGYSITEALKSKGYESSFAYRKKLWALVGKYTTYTGTSAQNKMLIELLGGTVFDIPNLKGYKGFSIVQGLKSFGYDSSFEYRKKLWSAIGKTSKYKGSATQNLLLLNTLKNRGVNV